MSITQDRKIHSFENHIADEIVELITVGRLIVEASKQDQPPLLLVTRFERAAKNAAMELSIRGIEIIPELTPSNPA